MRVNTPMNLHYLVPPLVHQNKMVVHCWNQARRPDQKILHCFIASNVDDVRLSLTLIEYPPFVALYKKTTCIWATKSIMAIRSQEKVIPSGFTTVQKMVVWMWVLCLPSATKTKSSTWWRWAEEQKRAMNAPVSVKWKWTGILMREYQEADAAHRNA